MLKIITPMVGAAMLFGTVAVKADWNMPGMNWGNNGSAPWNNMPWSSSSGNNPWNGGNWKMPSMGWGNNNMPWGSGQSFTMPNMNFGNGAMPWGSGSNFKMPNMNFGKNNMPWNSGSGWKMPSMDFGGNNAPNVGNYGYPMMFPTPNAMPMGGMPMATVPAFPQQNFMLPMQQAMPMPSTIPSAPLLTPPVQPAMPMTPVAVPKQPESTAPVFPSDAQAPVAQ